jgi:hypothetical protein
MPPSSALHSALDAPNESLAVADVSKAHDAKVNFRSTIAPDKPTLINLCERCNPRLNT